MTTSEPRALRQAPAATHQASLQAAPDLAAFERDQFWAARCAGDRPAMIHGSAKENFLRRSVHGLMAASLHPARTPAVA